MASKNSSLSEQEGFETQGEGEGPAAGVHAWGGTLQPARPPWAWSLIFAAVGPPRTLDSRLLVRVRKSR